MDVKKLIAEAQSNSNSTKASRKNAGCYSAEYNPDTDTLVITCTKVFDTMQPSSSNPQNQVYNINIKPNLPNGTQMPLKLMIRGNAIFTP